jgi:tetratricopeptide (TPR) repeat protein
MNVERSSTEGLRESRGRATGGRVTLVGAAVLSLWLGACATHRIHEQPIMENGDRVEVPSGQDAANPASAARMADERDRADSIRAAALAGCAGDVCEAIVRGELALGMSETQVLAATRTTSIAWRIRRSGPAVVLMPRTIEGGPSDVVADVAMVRLDDGRVASYAYREPTGLRLVSSPEDATTTGRAEALGEQLLREGDDLVARGDLDGALNRYDRADVLRPDDPMIGYRIATVLDKQLRPIEALIQYQLFLHQLELEKIEARGDAAAKMADAIARARERVIVLEKQTQ